MRLVLTLGWLALVPMTAVAQENGAVAITDHLGFTHGEPGGANVGHCAVVVSLVCP